MAVADIKDLNLPSRRGDPNLPLTILGSRRSMDRTSACGADNARSIRAESNEW